MEYPPRGIFGWFNMINVNKVEHVLCCQSFNALSTLLRFQKNAFSLSRGLLFRIFTWDNNFHLSPSLLCPVQTDENIHVANNSQYCWMLHVGSVRTALCTLLSVVGSCCPKFETVQTFSYVKTDATTPNDIVGRCYVCLQVVLDILLSKGNREQQGKFNL